MVSPPLGSPGNAPQPCWAPGSSHTRSAQGAVDKEGVAVWGRGLTVQLHLFQLELGLSSATFLPDHVVYLQTPHSQMP